MKYYYLFILFLGMATRSQVGVVIELNSEQGDQIDCLVITDQREEKAVINKAIRAGIAYYIGGGYNERTPMTTSNQFVIPVYKFGIPGKEPEYNDDNESPRLLLYTGTLKGCYS